MSFSRPGKCQTPVRRVRRVIEIHGLIRSVARGDPLDLEGQDVQDHGRALEPVQVELDRLELDAAKIADQMLADESWRTAGFATDDRSQGLTLRIVGPLVDCAGEDPVAVGHHFARADNQRKLEPIERHITVSAGINPEHQCRRAVVVGRRPLRVRIDARTEIVAVATLHVFAEHRPLLLYHGMALFYQAVGCCFLSRIRWWRLRTIMPVSLSSWMKRRWPIG